MATPLSSSRMSVTWVDQSSNETCFRLYRRIRHPDGASTAWTQVARPDANVTSFGDTGLEGNTRYQYQVHACNAVGCAPWTVGAITTTPPSGVAQPTSFTARPVSATQVKLAWIDASDNETRW